MTTYKNIIKSGSLNRKQRWLILGSNKPMVRDAFELAVEHAFSGDFTVAKTVFSGDSATKEELEGRLRQSVIEDRSLVVLLDADKYKHWDSLSPLLKDQDSKSFFIAVSNEDKADKKDPRIRTFMQSPKASLVECNEMSAEDYILWINTCLSIEPAAARKLVSDSNGDPEWLLNCIRKLQYLGRSEVSLEDVESLVTTKGLPKFEISLLYNNKADAIRYTLEGDMSAVDMYSAVEVLRQAALVYEASKTAGSSKRVIHDRTKINPAKIDRLRRLGKVYERAGMFRSISLLYSRKDGIFPVLSKWRSQSLTERW